MKRGQPTWFWVALSVPLGLFAVGMLYGIGETLWKQYQERARASASAQARAADAPTGPVFDGSLIDLSSVMGRARRLANEWDAEAALLAIEATLQAGKIQPQLGGTAKLTFGPSPFAPTPRRTGLFVVTYDQTGLHSVEDRGGTAGVTLPEPMCAPETVLQRVAELGVRPLLLRYALDSVKRPSWLVHPVSEPEQLRIFEPQACGPRGTIVVQPKR